MQPENPVSITSTRMNQIHRLFFALFLVFGLMEIINLFAAFKFSSTVESLFLLFAVAGTLANLTRQLPVQNVLLAAGGIALIGGLISLVGARTGIPFGPISHFVTPKFLNMPWTMPLIWVVAVLNARGVARLILRPWRKIKAYGFWLIGITAALVVLFDCALETFAHVRHLWLWQGSRFVWLTAPASNYFSWFVITLLILAFVTPVLINKQLSKSRGKDFYPFWIWLVAILIFAIAAAVSKLWLAAGIDAAVGLVTAILAVRGAKW